MFLLKYHVRDTFNHGKNSTLPQHAVEVYAVKQRIRKSLLYPSTVAYLTEYSRVSRSERIYEALHALEEFPSVKWRWKNNKNIPSSKLHGHHDPLRGWFIIGE